MPDSAFRRLTQAVSDGLGIPIGTTTGKATLAKERAADVGFHTVGFNDTDEDIADWEERLYHEQDEFLEQRRKEWERNILYASNRQYLAFHRDLRRWFPRRSAPWRIRSIYNVVSKAIRLRVARMTENKPTVTVQPASLDRDDIDAAESKELQFWTLWEKLEIHRKLRRARRWSVKCGIGFLKGGWDPEAGEAEPVTRFIEEVSKVLMPVQGDDGKPLTDLEGNAVEEEQDISREIEVFVNRQGKKVGPVTNEDTDAEGEQTKTRNDPPDGTDFINEGEVDISIRSPFNIRWDRWTDDIAESWVVQDADILPASSILGLWPDAKDKLREANPATDEQKADLQWEGLSNQETNLQGLGFTREGKSGKESVGQTNIEYMVRETWIFPKNDFVRQLWGKEGALLITIGGVLVRKMKLPVWAKKECPFIPFTEEYEEGNHYYKPFLRDIIPLQDDINRSRSHMAEGMSVSSRMIIGAVKNAQVDLKLAAQMPMVFLTYKTPAHEPKPLKFDANIKDAIEFYESSLSAAQDLGDMNEASTGRLPSAGLAAKAIYALQFADERSVTEPSQDQDNSLMRLAKLLDVIATEHYDEIRKVKIVGANRAYILERELKPGDLQAHVDYRFQPGSMLSRQKEAVRNEMFQLMEVGLMSLEDVKRALPSSVPEGIRGSYDSQEARARRQLFKLREGELEEADLMPWDDPATFIYVYEEFLTSARYEVSEQDVQNRVSAAWQKYTEVMQQQQQAAAQAEALAANPEAGVAPEPQAPIGEAVPADLVGVSGAQNLEAQAEGIAPPEEFQKRGDVLGASAGSPVSA